MTNINNIPEQFIDAVFANMETHTGIINEEQMICICEGYDNKLEPEEIASMLDKTNMINENEAGR